MTLYYVKARVPYEICNRKRIHYEDFHFLFYSCKILTNIIGNYNSRKLNKHQVGVSESKRTLDNYTDNPVIIYILV